MYYIKKIIITSEGKDGEIVKSELNFKPGLNIVYGPSNTGKTHVLDCIDFMLGGDAKRLYKKELKIKAVSMFIDSDGAELTMYRELAEETKNPQLHANPRPGRRPGKTCPNTAILKARKRIPFSTKLPETIVTRSEAMDAFDQLRREATDVPEMSLDEINEEISAVRYDRKNRKAGVLSDPKREYPIFLRWG